MNNEDSWRSEHRQGTRHFCGRRNFTRRRPEYRKNREAVT